MLDTEQINNEMNKLIIDRRFQEIIKKSDEMIDAYPYSYLGRWWKARAYTFLGDTDKALHWFMEALKNTASEEEESRVCSSFANVYNIRKDWHNSLKYSEIALELNPNNPVAIITRSIALSATGKKQEAYQLINEHRGIFREEYEKACIAAVLSNKEEMLQHLRNSIIENPHHKITVLYDPEFEPYLKHNDFNKLLKD